MNKYQVELCEIFKNGEIKTDRQQTKFFKTLAEAKKYYDEQATLVRNMLDNESIILHEYNATDEVWDEIESIMYDDLIVQYKVKSDNEIIFECGNLWQAEEHIEMLKDDDKDNNRFNKYFIFLNDEIIKEV